MEHKEMIEKTCKTCEHKGDSSQEYCGTCGEGETITSNWREAGWAKDKKIDKLQAEIALLKKKVEVSEKFKAMVILTCNDLLEKLDTLRRSK